MTLHQNNSNSSASRASQNAAFNGAGYVARPLVQRASAKKETVVRVEHIVQEVALLDNGHPSVLSSATAPQCCPQFNELHSVCLYVWDCTCCTLKKRVYVRRMVVGLLCTSYELPILASVMVELVNLYRTYLSDIMMNCPSPIEYSRHAILINQSFNQINVYCSELYNAYNLFFF